MVKLIKWIGVSESFKRLEHIVSRHETKCFKRLKLILELLK